jgi:hypothetical protein
MAPATMRTTNWGPDAITTNAASGIAGFPCAAITQTPMVTCADNTQPLPTHCQRSAKEYHRTTRLGQAAPLVTVNPTMWVAGQDRVKAKTTAISQMLASTNPTTKSATTPAPKPASVKKKRLAKAKPPTTVVPKAVGVKKKRLAKAKSPKTLVIPSPSPDPTATTQSTEGTINLCGCRHGDLEALKSLTKTETTYYTRPNRFLEGMACLDCKQAVVELLVSATNKTAVVFYCDEGIKGFAAPADDPMKAALVCDLVLCPPCEALRRMTFDANNHSRGGRGRNRGGR